MKFFAKLNYCHSAKNKAHQEIQDYARKVDATLLLSNDAREEFKAEFKKFIKEVNSRHTRCQNIQLSLYIVKHESISVDGNFSMTIYGVNYEK